MMPRKKRLVIVISSIILAILAIIGIFVFLYLNTDMFKSNETLFSKYLVQNLNAIQIFENSNLQSTQEILNNNKYDSELIGTIEYIENMGTSDENKENPLNDLKLTIKSQTDKLNNKYYRDISISEENEDLIKLEYLNQDKDYGIRLNGIKQFIVLEDDGTQEIEGVNIEDINNLINNIDISTIYNFTEEEKEILKNTYLGILQDTISKDRYNKQANSLITVNNQDVDANAYYIKLTIEELNNIYIKMLERITTDEIILSRIDNIENIIKENYEEYKSEETLRQQFIEEINLQIENIKNNNIGNDEVKITVYESNYKTVRTVIEKNTQKTTIDMYNNTFKIDYLELGETEKEQILKIENKSSDTESNINAEIEIIQANEIVLDFEIGFVEKNQNDIINRNVKINMANTTSELGLDLTENINIVNEFENEILLENNSIKLNDLKEEQKKIIYDVATNNINSQVEKLLAKVSKEDFMKVLQNIGILNNNIIEISDTGVISETEKIRFNSNFEFFQTNNLSTEDIKDLLEVTNNNFNNMAVMLETGELKELNINKLQGNSTESNEYNDSIVEVIIEIKQNSTNTEKQENVLKYLEKNLNKKFDVSLDYDDNGLVKYIRIKVQE